MRCVRGDRDTCQLSTVASEQDQDSLHQRVNSNLKAYGAKFYNVFEFKTRWLFSFYGFKLMPANARATNDL